MIFGDFGLSLSYETACFMQAIEDPSLPVEEVGELSLTVGHKLRSLAIMALVSKNERLIFGQNLIRSGRIRLDYLVRIRREGLDNEYHSASGRIEGLMDAIAASDLELGRQIVSVSRNSWLQDAEYEDDFCYAQLIHGILQGADKTAGEAIIDQFEKVLDGKPNPRLDVCRALLNQDQTAFEQAFRELLLDREAKIAADKARFQLEEPEVMAQRLIYIEGLAVLRLATLLGLQTETDYLFCPAIARLTQPFNVVEE